MAARTFAQINCSLLRSKKIASVSLSARWTYMCAHLTPSATFTGVSNYPAVLWMRDAGLRDDEFAGTLANLIDVGLVEWSEEEELVRIVGYHRQRPPQNASWCINIATDFEGMLTTYDDAGMVLRGAAEFAVAAVAKSTKWKPDSPEIPKLRESIGRFLRATCRERRAT